MTSHDSVTSRRPLIIVPDGDPETKSQLDDLLRADGEPSFDLRIHEDVPTCDDEWVERTREADGLLLSWQLPDRVLLESDSLKVVSFCGTGVSDHVDLEIAAERGIAVTNVTGYGDNAVAEHALALLFSVVANIPRVDAAIRAGGWPQLARWEVAGKRVGVVGLGGIGRRFAELAAACGMEVVVWSRREDPGLRDGISYVGLDELFRTSDAVSIHLALNAETEGLIGESLLRSMKPHSVLINTARAGLVDTMALARILDEGRILGAGLDVFDEEPIAPGHPLLSSERATLTAHIAFNTNEASATLLRKALANLTDFFAVV